MSNRMSLAGAVLLEAYWETRQKDMLDLISPFVQYGVATTTVLGERIDTSKVTEILRNDFGYVDMPEAVVFRIVNRDKDHYTKKNKQYYLTASLDNQVEHFNSRKSACLSKINSIGNELYEFLSMHCKKTRILSAEQCVGFLQEFFAQFALQISFNSLEQETISHKNDEVNYYIARFIFDKKDENGIEYDIIMDLTKGYLLRSAIYLQIENPNINTASYRNTSFFYDTPFLIQLLGFQSDKEAESARSLHACLRRLGAKFYYFPQNEEELNNILVAYQYSLIGKQKSSRTLDGLDKKEYGFSDVQRIKNSFPSMLKEQYGIERKMLPSYSKNDAGTIDVDKVDISEKDAIRYVRQNTKHYSEENLISDVASAVGIHFIRNGITSQSIENCVAIFVTTNVDFTRAFNEFYKANVNKNIVMPVITDFNLSAIAWVKGGTISTELPERQLLMNAYLAMQPAPELMDRCRKVLSQLESEGKITEEDAISLRADRVTQRELWIECFPEEESIDENYIKMLQEKQRIRLVGEKEKELAIKYKQESEEAEQRRIQAAQNRAKVYANDKKKKYKRVHKILATIIIIIITCLCIAGLMKTMESIDKSVFIVAFIIVSIISIVDTLRVRSKFLGKWIEKRANYYETKKYEEKMEEYRFYD